MQCLKSIGSVQITKRATVTDVRKINAVKPFEIDCVEIAFISRQKEQRTNHICTCAIKNTSCKPKKYIFKNYILMKIILVECRPPLINF